MNMKYIPCRLLIAVFLLFISCEKIENQIEHEGGSTIALRFSVEGILEKTLIESGSSNKASISSVKRERSVGDLQDILWETDEGNSHMDSRVSMALVSVGELESNPVSVLKSKNHEKLKASSQNTQRTFSPMEKGVKYRVLVFKGDINNLGTENLQYIDEIDGESGRLSSGLQIDAGKGNVYSWIAYSYNDKSDLDSVRFTGHGAQKFPTIRIFEDKDFILAEGTLSAEEPKEYKVPISFLRKARAIEVKLDFNGLYGDADVNNTEFLISGKEYESIPTEISFHLDGSKNLSGKQKSSSINGARWIKKGGLLSAVVYRPFPNQQTDNNDIKYTLRNIKVDRMGYSFEDGPKEYPKTKPLTSDPNYYSFSINFFDKSYGLAVRDGGPKSTSTQAGFTIWSEENLVYDFTNKRYVFGNAKRINDLNLNEPFNGEFWNWNTTVPYIKKSSFQTQSIQNVGDPCGMAYPQGKWRLPTAKEASFLFLEMIYWGSAAKINRDDVNKYYSISFPEVPLPINKGYPKEFKRKFSFTVNGYVINNYFTPAGTGIGKKKYKNDYYTIEEDEKMSMEERILDDHIDKWSDYKHRYSIFDPNLPIRNAYLGMTALDGNKVNNRTSSANFWTSTTGQHRSTDPSAQVANIKVDDNGVEPGPGIITYPNYYGNQIRCVYRYSVNTNNK
ncbi:MAG TPA: hypothetical protein DCP54_03810 [Chryseobacterium sp.]|nr:hypothetical protein [Chryseobacterium sp.]